MLDKLFCLYGSSALRKDVGGVLRSNLPPVVRDTLHPVRSTQRVGPYHNTKWHLEQHQHQLHGNSPTPGRGPKVGLKTLGIMREYLLLPSLCFKQNRHSEHKMKNGTWNLVNQLENIKKTFQSCYKTLSNREGRE